MDVLSHFELDDVHPGVCLGNGQWLADKKQDKLISINPANEQPLGHVIVASEMEYEQVLSHAQRHFLQWREVPAPKRAELIHEIGLALRKEKSYLGTLVSLEMGKSKQEGDGEVQEMIDMADFAVGQARMLYGKTMHSERKWHRMYEQWHPLGVVGVISAFNFPVAVWAWNAFLAAICGNTVVWKPSHKTPLCALAVQKICNRVMTRLGMEGVFSLFISNDRTLAERFCEDKRVSLVSFTGSTAVGKQVAQVVSQRLGKVLLELGGNNAVIVDESADLKLAIPAIVFGAVGTAGQRCTSTRRVFIHEAIYHDVVKALVHAYAQVTIGDPLSQANLMGPLVDQQAVDQYGEAIKNLQQLQANFLFGGGVLPEPGFFVEPTLVEAQPDWDMVQQETFAPILYVMKFSDLASALSMQNQVPQGLSSALFTRDLKNAEYFLSAMGSDCGIANVNIGTSGAEIGGAFGGEKETGGGREAGSDAWQAYMRRQTNTINWSDDLPLAQGIQFNLK